MTPSLLSKLKQNLNDNEVYKFYQTKEWKFLRSQVRKRNNNECQQCKKNGKQSRADMVHHIKEVRQYPELALDSTNCEPLCNSCHNREHPEKLANYQNKIKKFQNEERW